MSFIKNLIPNKLLRLIAPYYHFLLAFLATHYYHTPSKEIYVIGVTGTKGKSSTVELVSHALRGAGKKVATLSTIHFRIGDDDVPNMYKMTQPGRFFTQSFIRRAVDAGCDYAVIELTSEGARYYRHAGVQLDTLIFTNLSPEHIESHGGFDNYKKAKLRLVDALKSSPKRPRISISNGDDEHGKDFLAAVELQGLYSLTDAASLQSSSTGSTFSYRGHTISLPVPGIPMVYNTLAALKFCEARGISIADAISGIESLQKIRGRFEEIENTRGLRIVVDYAHTEDSLTKLYLTYPGKKIGVLGSTGGGRDTAKRAKLGAVADMYCDAIVITNEDPYDDDPLQIIADVASGVMVHTPTLILDRKEAIRAAILHAKEGDTILISGKGTDPYIMGARGSKIPWDDAMIVREVLHEIAEA